MDTVLSHMDVDRPTASVNGDSKKGPVAPEITHEQEKQVKDKTDELGRKDKMKSKEKKEKKKKEKKGISHDGEPVESKKRKHVEVNGDAATEVKKKKKKKSAVG